jgi:hypothetical protein
MAHNNKMRKKAFFVLIIILIIVAVVVVERGGRQNGIYNVQQKLFSVCQLLTPSPSPSLTSVGPNRAFIITMGICECERHSRMWNNNTMVVKNPHTHNNEKG